MLQSILTNSANSTQSFYIHMCIFVHVCVWLLDQLDKSLRKKGLGRISSTPTGFALTLYCKVNCTFNLWLLDVIMHSRFTVIINTIYIYIFFHYLFLYQTWMKQIDIFTKIIFARTDEYYQIELLLLIFN